MVESIARITLDVQNMSASTVVPVKQGDTGRKIIVSLADGGFPYEIAADCYAVLTATKPDGNILYNHCDIEENTIVYAVTEQTTAAAGRMPCEIKLYGADDSLITSARFRIIVDGTIYGDNKVESKDEVSALTHLVSEATTVIQAGNDLNAQGQQAIEEVQTATQEAILATGQAEQAAADADEAAESASAAALAADLAAGRTNQAIQNAQTATQEASDAAGAANDAADRAQGALAVAEKAAETAAQMAGDAEQAVKDANFAIEGAEEATIAANAAADRANAASDIAYEANEKVDTLREVVSKFHSNIIEEASGEVITLSDASDLELAGLKVFGKTEQRTTTGKNLVDPNNVLPRSNATISNGVVTQIEAGGTANEIFKVRTLNSSMAVVASVNGGYPIAETRSALTFEKTDDVQYVLFGQNGATKDTTCYADISSMPNGKYTVSVLFTNVTQGTVSWCDMQIESGSTATAYEPYTGGIPSPNPNYPQALESVGDGGSVGITVVGKNLLDSTQLQPSTIMKYYQMKMKPNGVYTLSTNLPKTYNDDDSAYLFIISGTNTSGLSTNGHGAWNGQNRTVTPDSDGIVTVCYRADNTNVSSFDGYQIQLEYGSTATAYEAYKENQSLPMTTFAETALSSGNPLAGIPVTDGGNYTDENGQQWICNYRDWGRGVDVQRIYRQIYTNGNNVSVAHKDWLFNLGTLSGMAEGNIAFSLDKILCNYFARTDRIWSSEGVGILANNRTVTIGIPGYSVDEVRTWIAQKYADGNPLTIDYVLATPIETPVPEAELAAYAALHTNYPNTTVFNDAGAHMEVKYVADTKLYVDKKFAELAQALVSST